MIEFSCWGCGKSLKAKEEAGGKKCKCSGCGRENTIPVEGETNDSSSPEAAFVDIPVTTQEQPEPAVKETLATKRRTTRVLWENIPRNNPGAAGGFMDGARIILIILLVMGLVPALISFMASDTIGQVVNHGFMCMILIGLIRLLK